MLGWHCSQALTMERLYIVVKPPSKKPVRGVEQLAARLAHNQEAVGSSPTTATSDFGES